MAAVDDDIRADFLVEAGELVEALPEQLMQLEQQPDDAALLGAIFRAFHTVKGGAGFLDYGPMVELCHVTEDLFNLLRSGKRVVSPELMDVVLKASDCLQKMMREVVEGGMPAAAPADLLASLRALCSAEEKPKSKATKGKTKTSPAQHPAPQPPPAGGGGVAAGNSKDTITEDEFEALLDQLQAEKKSPPVIETPKTASPPPEGGEKGEGTLKPATAPAAETTVRVDTHRLDKLMNLVGELVLVRNRLRTLRGSDDVGSMVKAVAQLDFITRDLQGAVMQIRMQPVKKVFSRFPKVARDLARQLGKQVEVTLIGEDTDLDKNLVEALADPLVHMVRNAMDHAIEVPEARARAGKPPAGKLTLAACQQGDHILITVEDDGAGIDPERLRSKVIEKGLVDAAAAARLTHEECLQLVFLPGLSTKEQVSDLSGRGVGMDVVKAAITRLSGTVKIESKIGSGSRVVIRVPLTLAILPALMVRVCDRSYALPLAAVADVFMLDPGKLRRLDRWDMVMVRGEPLRLVHLDRWVGAPMPPEQSRHVVVAQVGSERYGFVVREVRGREEVVIKPLGPLLRGLAGLAGATVTGEGRVALILDFAGLVAAARTS